MNTFNRIMVALILLWTFLYTASYARWTWKKKNKLGAVMVFLLSLAILVIPVYAAIYR